MGVSNLLTVTVKQVATPGKEKVFFSRSVDVTPDTDINVILSALRMLFHSEMFRITIDTYGA